jgi:Dephospho-CoA kinase
LGIAIALAGSLASGKTQLARQLCDKCHMSCASFGPVIIREAKGRGISLTRRGLQDLGEAIESELGPSHLVDRALELAQITPQAQVVFDSVRHDSVWREIRNRYSSSFLIYLEVPQSVAIARLVARDRIDEDSARQAIHHPMEVRARELRSVANIILSTGSVEEWVERVLEALPGGGSEHR